MEDKIIYDDPFLGKIVLTKFYELQKHAMGEDAYHYFYIDKYGSYYIQSSLLSDTSNNIRPRMNTISKEFMEILVSHFSGKK